MLDLKITETTSGTLAAAGAIMFDRNKMRYSNVIRKKCKFR